MGFNGERKGSSRKDNIQREGILKGGFENALDFRGLFLFSYESPSIFERENLFKYRFSVFKHYHFDYEFGVRVHDSERILKMLVLVLWIHTKL